ncbi:MAG: hypothetical protein M3323_13480 [Actinomycetota bacterium]|nr:hypothetical protein [Actinomycetota bacterium]
MSRSDPREFIAPIRGATNQKKVLATLYYFDEYEKRSLVRAQEIKTALIAARVSNARTMNVSDVLTRCGHLVDSPGSDGVRRVWQLTSAGKSEVRSLLNLGAELSGNRDDVRSLEEVVRAVEGGQARGFLEEALACLRVGALRATVVFVWSGVARTLQERALASVSRTELNSAIKKHDPGARNVRSVDDFAFIRDAVALDAFRDLGFFDKGQGTFLKHALDLRNQCGHPSKYQPREKKVSGFIEDVIGIVFLSRQEGP